MTKKNGVNFSTQVSAQARRKSALERLETQLKLGMKTPKGNAVKPTIPLTDKDRIRIQKEIEILKSRV